MPGRRDLAAARQSRRGCGRPRPGRSRPLASQFGDDRRLLGRRHVAVADVDGLADVVLRALRVLAVAGRRDLERPAEFVADRIKALHEVAANPGVADLGPSRCGGEAGEVRAGSAGLGQDWRGGLSIRNTRIPRWWDWRRRRQWRVCDARISWLRRRHGVRVEARRRGEDRQVLGDARLRRHGCRRGRCWRNCWRWRRRAWRRKPPSNVRFPLCFLPLQLQFGRVVDRTEASAKIAHPEGDRRRLLRKVRIVRIEFPKFRQRALPAVNLIQFGLVELAALVVRVEVRQPTGVDGGNLEFRGGEVDRLDRHVSAPRRCRRPKTGPGRRAPTFRASAMSRCRRARWPTPASVRSPAACSAR